MSSTRGSFGNVTSPRPCADAWCVYEMDGANNPVVLDSFGVSSVTRVQSGVSRVTFTNPENFASGAYVGLVQAELGNAPYGYGIGMIHGSTSSTSNLAIGTSASCDIVGIGMYPEKGTLTPTGLPDSPNNFKARYNAAFFCLRSDSELYKTSVANLIKQSEYFYRSPWVKGDTADNTTLKVLLFDSETPFGKISPTNSFRSHCFSSTDDTRNYIAQPASIYGIDSKTYTFSVYAQPAKGNTIGLQCGGLGNSFGFLYNLATSVIAYTGPTPIPNGATCSGSMVNIGNGWKRCILTYVPSTGKQSVPTILIPKIPDPAIETDKNFYIWGAQLEEGSVVNDYIKTEATVPVYGNQEKLVRFSPGVCGSGQYSSQNLLKYSQTFTDALWTKTRIGVSAGGYTAPDGTTTAMKLYELDPSDPNSAPTGGLYYKGLRQSFGNMGYTAGSGTYTFSVYAKAAERKYLTIVDFAYGKFGNLVVDLSNGAVTQNTQSYSTPLVGVARGNIPLNVSTKYCGNGWWRVATTIVTPIITSTPSAELFGFAPNPGATTNSLYGPTNPGVSGSGILIWGAQLERGTVLSEYTPTTANIAGTTFTRLSGNTYASTPANLKNQREATAWGTIVIPPNASVSSNVSAYLENAYGVNRVVARNNSVFDVYFTKKMDAESYCVITGTEQETVNLPESGVGSDGSIPTTGEFTLNTIKDLGGTANSQRSRAKFTVISLRQDPADNTFKPQSIHYQLGRTQRIHFMVFGGRTSYGTA